MGSIKLRNFKGTRDFTPRDMIQREPIIETIKGVFRCHGFSPMETPALEMLEIISGKYGDESEKMLYKLDYKTDKPSGRVALRYDLTVPLARVVAMHPEWPMPFKRYQIQPVWRADQPQKRQGRFREFYQCDVDTIGAEEGIADVEIIAVTVELLRKLGFEGEGRRALVQINHLRLLEGLCEYSGLPASELMGFCRALDKLDKIGMEGVEAELTKIGVKPEGMKRLRGIFGHRGSPIEVLSTLKHEMKAHGAALEGIKSLYRLFAYLVDHGIPNKAVSFQPSLARGLDYYTGAVFEAALPDHPHIGSLSGGGRYDKLIGLYSGRDLPAVGTTIGLDRIFSAMEQMGMIAGKVATVTRVLIVAYSEDEVPYALEALSQFQKADIPSELYPRTGKLKRPFSYADKLGIDYVAVIGPDESLDPERLKVSLKSMASGEQTTISVDEAIGRVKRG